MISVDRTGLRHSAGDFKDAKWTKVSFPRRTAFSGLSASGQEQPVQLDQPNVRNGSLAECRLRVGRRRLLPMTGLTCAGLIRAELEERVAKVRLIIGLLSNETEVINRHLRDCDYADE